jgi:hypothetical protein
VAPAALAKTGTPGGRGTDLTTASPGAKTPPVKSASTTGGEKPGNVPLPAGKATAEAVATDAHPPDAGASLKTSGVATLPPVTFDNVKLLVVDGDRSREQDAKVRLADGRILLYGPDTRVLASMSYDSVRGLSFARSRQPRWRNPDGTDGDIKLSGGPLGFMKSDRNWLAIATRDAVYVIRVDDGSLSRLIHATTQRTGAPVARLASK